MMTIAGDLSQNIRMRHFLFLVLIVLIAVSAYPQTPAAGTVHSSVTVAAQPTNSYALYLPSAYSPAKRWPLILIFDPFARGEVSVKLFHDAAEKYGFILVGSNNTRNFEDPSGAIRALWTEMKEHYAIDPRRIYTAGLSGGARVASSVALACKTCIAGVIANSAGLPNGAALPGPEVSEWFLAAGTTDFNYTEQLHLKETLDARHVVSRFVVFDGPHNWMPKEFADRALAWFQLRAMVKGLIPMDKEFVAAQFDSRLAEAQAEQKAGDVLAATRSYGEIAQDFSKVRDVKEQESLAKTLAASEETRKARKAEKEALKLQDETSHKIGDTVAGLTQGQDVRGQYMVELNSVVNEANDEQRKLSSPAMKQAIARAMASAFSFAIESGQQMMLKKNPIRARTMFEAGEVIQPESAWASYLVATAEAELGLKKQAIEDLKKAMAKGLTSATALDDNAFDRIRNDAEFKELSAKLAAGKKL
jgi:tetratricopeptide (TPR) repeat protein